MARSPLLNGRKFLPLFAVQFLNALNDNILKAAILVMISYEGLLLWNLNTELSVNLATLLFILPFFLFSSYAGKIADTYCKVKLVRIIKVCEILIIAIAGIGFIAKSISLMLISLTLMGIHSTFFGPIKYSILPQYIEERKSLLLANGFVELGTFVAVLVGQLLGSWYAANRQFEIVTLLLALATSFGLILSFRLEKTLLTGVKHDFDWNVIKDTIKLYKKVAVNKNIRNDIHSISWFWAVGIVYTAQLPLFTQRYMGGDAHVYSILLMIFSVSIGIGSLVCAYLSNGQIHKSFVIAGSLGISIFSLLLLFVNHHTVSLILGLSEFSHSWIGVINYILIFLIGFSAGFYSVTCYNELQVISPLGSLSQVIATTNVFNALYMVVAAGLCTLLLLFMSIWWLFIVLILANLFFVIWYWCANYKG